MRTLTAALLGAMRAHSHTPYIEVKATNNLSGVLNLRWSRLYTGVELDSAIAITMPGDGSLIRIRATPASDSRKLYRQRVAAPGVGSVFSNWTYLDYGVMAVAACSLAAEVSLFWVKADGEITRAKSTDYGATWAIDYPGYAPTGAVLQMAAAYKSNGDLALFVIDTYDVYLFKRVAAVWQARVKWDKTAGTLSGIAAIYDADWKLIVSGQDIYGDFKVWSSIYGDGGEAAVGLWTVLKEITSAPYGGSFEYLGVFLDKPDVYRCFFVEKFTGVEAYTRPFWSHTAAGSTFLYNRWREPVPFNFSTAYGLAMAHTSTNLWASSPAGVWRAALTIHYLDLSPDVISAKCELAQDSDRLTVELSNVLGFYAQPGEGDIAFLDNGCQIDFSPGYLTSVGNRISAGLTFTLQGYEHVSTPGVCSMILHATGGWEDLQQWVARYQMRWNKVPGQVYWAEILAQVLAKVGIRLVTVSASVPAMDYRPDFTIHPGDNGRTVVQRLLSFVPDVLFIEGSIAYLVYTSSIDASVYNYGLYHSILEGRYFSGAWKVNRVQAEGVDALGAPVVAESYDWTEVINNGDRLSALEDLNITTVALGQERGVAYLRQAQIEAVSGYIRVPVQPAQQLYDVIDVTDSRANLTASKRRVLGSAITYLPAKAQYDQVLKLGGV